MLVNQVGTSRDALTVTESLEVRLVVGVTVTLSLARPFFRYWVEAVVPAEPSPAGSWLAPASAEASAALCTWVLFSAQKP